MKIRKLAILGILFGTLFGLSACSLNKITADSTASALYEGKSVMEEESDIQFVRDSFPASLLTMETFLVN